MKTLLISLLLSVPAWAGKAERAPAKEKVVYSQKTELDFTEKSVESQFQSPEGANVKGDDSLDFDPLLKSKDSFQNKNQWRSVR